ncbi:hypothetical protein DM01DRAFT_1335871, partial [Hesseltinella vesiculosa]
MDLESNVNQLGISDYEAHRQRQIEQNRQLLRELGLAKDNDDASPPLALLEIPKTEAPNILMPKKKNKYTGSKAATRISLPTSERKSRRLRGEQPDDTVELQDLLDEQDRIRQAAMEAKLKRQRDEDAQILPDNVSVPLTLTSIGTTIWELGKLYTGDDRKKYWSSHGCRYKHPYPIGFRATKSHFGNNYTMTISEGKPGEGPVFSVRVNESQTTFEGPTPTAPWTDACKRSNSQGTRVSGPLFYGFSDLLTMHLIQDMDNYDDCADSETLEKASKRPRRSTRAHPSSS